MGGKHLEEIIHQLLRFGRSDSTPIAIIKRAGTPDQQVWQGDLSNIVKQTAGLPLSPVVIVVGQVVALSKYL
jgi:siroheme synthase